MRLDAAVGDASLEHLMDLGIEGRVALVLGASKGLGRAVATELAAEGARLAVASRTAENLAGVVADTGAVAFEHDNADLDAAPALIEAVTGAVGPIDILVTNTGGPPPRPDPLSHPRDEWEVAYRTLVLAPLALIEAAISGMQERGWGRIVNIASFTVREPMPALMLSNSHRAATFAAFKTIARSVGPSGVTLNSVLPGRIATERNIQLVGSREKAEQMARDEVPLGRLGTPEEIAAAVAFLCSDRAGYITGVGLLVDGGLSRLV
ncbi:MAG: SDR family oxidoreductase [Solirubrobacteraceae bacterium]